MVRSRRPRLNDDDDDCRARLLAVFVFVAAAGIIGGMVIGALLDWLHV